MPLPVGIIRISEFRQSNDGKYAVKTIIKWKWANEVHDDTVTSLIGNREWV